MILTDQQYNELDDKYDEILRKEKIREKEQKNQIKCIKNNKDLVSQYG